MVSILIVNWRTRDYLRSCLVSLRALPATSRREIIVVENASGDGACAMVRAEFPECVLIENTQNHGFAAANNQAYGVSHGDYIWLLNPDTQVAADAEKGLLECLLRHPEAGAAGSQLLDAQSGRPQQSCRTFPWPAALWAEATGLARLYPRSRRFGFYRLGWLNYQREMRVDQPMASSLLLRREAIEAAGGLFDEDFPIFFNDVDLCWRLRQAGFACWYTPDSRVRHWGGASTAQAGPAMIAESHRGLRRFYEKHWRRRFSPVLYWSTMLLMEAAGRVRQLRAEGAASP